MRIFLVRHGESEGNVDRDVNRRVADHAIDLSPRGRGQAKGAGAFLANLYKRENPAYPASGKFPFRCWVSPYKRTRETARLLLGEMEAATGAVAAFGVREHVHLAEQQFGLFDGLDDDQLRALYPREHEHYEKCQAFEGRFWARMPLGESRFDVALRVHQAFGTFHRDAEKHGIHDIVVVAHGTTIRAFVMQWLHLPVEWFEKEPNPKNCSIRLIENGQDLGYIYEGGT